ncbi:hypothetical protein CR513_25911, partial [Mucuna pruriens]
MEQAIEDLEQQNLKIRAEMRMEMGQMREQINKMFEIITWNAAPTPAVATKGVAPSAATQEGFKDCAQRWRELATQVQPPLSE